MCGEDAGADTYDGLLLPVALDGGLKDRVAVLRVLERDALYGAGNLLHLLDTINRPCHLNVGNAVEHESVG